MVATSKGLRFIQKIYSLFCLFISVFVMLQCEALKFARTDISRHVSFVPLGSMEYSFPCCILYGESSRRSKILLFDYYGFLIELKEFFLLMLEWNIVKWPYHCNHVFSIHYCPSLTSIVWIHFVKIHELAWMFISI